MAQWYTASCVQSETLNSEGCFKGRVDTIEVSVLKINFELPSGQVVTALSLAWIYFHLPEYFYLFINY